MWPRSQTLNSSLLSLLSTYASPSSLTYVALARVLLITCFCPVPVVLVFYNANEGPFARSLSVAHITNSPNPSYIISGICTPLCHHNCCAVSSPHTHRPIPKSLKPATARSDRCYRPSAYITPAISSVPPPLIAPQLVGNRCADHLLPDKTDKPTHTNHTYHSADTRAKSTSHAHQRNSEMSLDAPLRPQPHDNPNVRANINISTLNMNGLAAPSHGMNFCQKWSTINSTLNQHKLAILALQETHLDLEMTEHLHQSLGEKMRIISSAVPDAPRSTAGVAFVINKR